MGRVEIRSVDDWAKTLGWIMLAVLAAAIDPRQAAPLTALITESIDAQPTNLVMIKLDDRTNIPLSLVDRYQQMMIEERIAWR